MSIILRIQLFTLGLLLILPRGAFAQSTVQGEVKGVDGRPSRGAEVKLERQDKKGAPMVLKTDRSGRFTANKVSAGNYNAMVTAEGGVTSPVQLIKVLKNKPVILTFDLRQTRGAKGVAGAKKKNKYVWVPDETGSHLGGRYVEVTDDATAGDTQTPNFQKGDGRLLQRLQSNELGRDPSSGGR